MNPPEAYNAAFATTQYYFPATGQPVARYPWPRPEPWSYDGDVARLAAFNYPCQTCSSSFPLSQSALPEASALPVSSLPSTPLPTNRHIDGNAIPSQNGGATDPFSAFPCRKDCPIREEMREEMRACCPSIYDVTNPANRKGGEYYNALADVNHYDDGNTGSAWWGSAQTCATNCGWQQGERACERAALATQPMLDVRRDYAFMAPFRRDSNAFGPERTLAPRPGQPSYLQYYAGHKQEKAVVKQEKAVAAQNSAQKSTMSPSSSSSSFVPPNAPSAPTRPVQSAQSLPPSPPAQPAFAALVNALITAKKAQQQQIVTALQQQLVNNVSAVNASGYPATATALAEFLARLQSFLDVLARAEWNVVGGTAAALGDAKSRLYDQSSAVAATLDRNAQSRESWWQFVHAAIKHAETV